MIAKEKNNFKGVLGIKEKIKNECNDFSLRDEFFEESTSFILSTQKSHSLKPKISWCGPFSNSNIPSCGDIDIVPNDHKQLEDYEKKLKPYMESNTRTT